MPRILTPNTSFQRRSSRSSSRALSWHGYPTNSYRLGSNQTLVARRQETRNSFGDQSSIAEAKYSVHLRQCQNNPTPLPNTIHSPNANQQQSPSHARYPVVSRRRRNPSGQISCRQSSRPSTNAKEEEWGQFVDVADEEEKLMRLLSRTRV